MIKKIFRLHCLIILCVTAIISFRIPCFADHHKQLTSVPDESFLITTDDDTTPDDGFDYDGPVDDDSFLGPNDDPYFDENAPIEPLEKI